MKRLLGQLGLIAVMSLLGCASITPETVNLLAQIAGQAAQIGAQNWLVRHPDQRQLFDDVIAAITVLVRVGITNQHAYVEQLNRLPTTALASDSGAVVVTSTNLVIVDTKRSKATVLKEPATMPVVKATLGGLRKGTGPLPPVPVAAVAPAKRRPPAGMPVPTVKAATQRVGEQRPLLPLLLPPQPRHPLESLGR